MSSSGPEPANILTTTLFFVTSIWFIRSSRRRSDRYRSEHASSLDEASMSLIGSRGSRVVTPVLPYVKCFLDSMQNPCDPSTNPEGHIALCVAENKLIQEPLAYRLMTAQTAITAFSNSISYDYSGFLGLPPAREAVAHFITKRFLCWNEDEEGVIHPENIVLGSGCGGLLNHLFFVLAEEGDGVMIPAPYYAKFESDMKTVAKCTPFPVYSKNPIMGPSIQDLNLAAHQAEKKGLKLKILLLNNPNNPLGVIYPPHVIRDAIGWARNRGMHTIVNEIYALSTRESTGFAFQSVIKVLDNRLSNDVHFLWGVSKDFGACGFRIGTLYTQNKPLLLALANLNTFSAVSQPMQMILADLLTDDAFLDYFLDEARTRLLYNYEICTRKLQEMVIPYTPALAGLFVYVDFSSLLPTMDFEGEGRFAQLVQSVGRIVMAPGESMRDRRPGMFRVSYACVSADVLEIAMERLSFLVKKIRKIDWEDFSEEYFGNVTKFQSQHGMQRRTSFNASGWTKGEIQSMH